MFVEYNIQVRFKNGRRTFVTEYNQTVKKALEKQFDSLVAEVTGNYRKSHSKAAWHKDHKYTSDQEHEKNYKRKKTSVLHYSNKAAKGTKIFQLEPMKPDIKGRFIAWNHMDGIPITTKIFGSVNQAASFINEWVKRFEKQGYYKDNKWNKIPLNELDIDVYKLEKGETAYTFSPYVTMPFKTGGNIPVEGIKIEGEHYSPAELQDIKFGIEKAFKTKFEDIDKERLFKSNVIYHRTRQNREKMYSALLEVESKDTGALANNLQSTKKMRTGGKAGDENGNKTYFISGGGFAGEVVIHAKTPDEAIEKAQEKLKLVFGHIPKNRFKVRPKQYNEGGPVYNAVMDSRDDDKEDAYHEEVRTWIQMNLPEEYWDMSLDEIPRSAFGEAQYIERTKLLDRFDKGTFKTGGATKGKYKIPRGFSKELETEDFIYYIDEDGEQVIMTRKSDGSLVSDNYFAENDLYERMVEIANGRESYVYLRPSSVENLADFKEEFKTGGKPGSGKTGYKVGDEGMLSHLIMFPINDNGHFIREKVRITKITPKYVHYEVIEETERKGKEGSLLKHSFEANWNDIELSPWGNALWERVHGRSRFKTGGKAGKITQADVRKLYDEAMDLFNQYYENDGDLEYSDKEYGYLNDALDEVAIGYFDEAPDGSYQEQLDAEKFKMSAKEAYDSLKHRIQMINEELGRFKTGGKAGKSDNLKRKLDEFLRDPDGDGFGIYGYTNRIHEIMTGQDNEYKPEDLDDYLQEEGIYGYTSRIKRIYAGSKKYNTGGGVEEWDDNKVYEYLREKYPDYTDNKLDQLDEEDYDYDEIFFEMVDDVREKFNLVDEEEGYANDLVERYMGGYKTGGKTGGIANDESKLAIEKQEDGFFRLYYTKNNFTLKYSKNEDELIKYRNELIKLKKETKYARGGGVKKKDHNLKKGVKVELEHKDTIEKIKSGNYSIRQAAEMIAKDHLAENKNYYDELAKIEKKFGIGGLTYQEETKSEIERRIRRLKDLLARVNAEDRPGIEESIRQSEKLLKNAPEGSYLKGGGMLKKYRDQLDAMTDDELAEEWERNTGVSKADALSDMEDERETYIDELVFKMKQVGRSRGEKFKTGGNLMNRPKYNAYSLLAENKFQLVLKEFKEGKLYSSSGDKVTDKKQALAIAYSEARDIDPSFGKKYNGGGSVSKPTDLSNKIERIANEVCKDYPYGKLKITKGTKPGEDNFLFLRLPLAGLSGGFHTAFGEKTMSGQDFEKSEALASKLLSEVVIRLTKEKALNIEEHDIYTLNGNRVLWIVSDEIYKYAKGGGINAPVTKYTDLSKLPETDFVSDYQTTMFENEPKTKAKPKFKDLRVAPEFDMVETKKKLIIPEEKITSSQQAYEILRKYWDQNKIGVVEHFNVLFLNRQNQVIGLWNVSHGGLSATIADREYIAAGAIKMLAQGIIIAHNHPSGTLKPSEADIQMTKKLAETCKTIDVMLLDHLIITDNAGYFSFADNGIMPG